MNKKCNKCKTEYSPEEWKNLRYIGTQEGFDDIPAMELRNCPCGSTLAKPVTEGKLLLKKFIQQTFSR